MAELSTQDTLFLKLETPEAPMHLGLLMTCRLPKGASPDFMQELQARLARFAADSEPFNLQLVERRRLGRYSPCWEIAKKVDLEYHLSHEALPWPGGQRELGLAISRLHSLPLERSRPLWEATLVEGLRPDRFALYLKIHHSLGDGIGLINKVASALATSARGVSVPPWTEPPAARVTARPTQSADEDWRRFFAEVLGNVGRTLTRARSGQLIPHGPRCVLNGDSTGRRRVATQELSLPRIRAVARAADATVNDVVLAVCSGALRAYLAQFDRIPKESLLVTVPVALPRPEGETLGTAVASIHTAIATQQRDPRKRLLAIRDAMREAKEEFKVMPVSLHKAINSVGMQLMMMVPKRETTDPARAAFTNLTVSNVPGPTQRLYFFGAEVDGLYPVSVLSGDQRLNITALSYDKSLHFGLVACPDTLPSVQYLALQLPVALRELEAALEGTARAKGKAARGKRTRASR
ncbi:MAG: wax ester/triacylglycerol synthase family O-acyltransferase [Steroidobacteraceae bacterium]|nr:wax ester/triacylglycerol synthase family O-acyltransferase [Steroidobacteraceae bacterium]MBP7012691.1 wax ester/triacylglycerol synthase family O-acyltransferase [Steroidobacteraceae bacterium]